MDSSSLIFGLFSQNYSWAESAIDALNDSWLRSDNMYQGSYNVSIGQEYMHPLWQTLLSYFFLDPNIIEITGVIGDI